MVRVSSRLLSNGLTIMLDLIDAHPDPDKPDSYYTEYDPDAGWHNHGEVGSEFGGSEAYEDPGSVAPSNTEEWGDEGTEAGYMEGERDAGDILEGDDEVGDGDFDACVCHCSYDGLN